MVFSSSVMVKVADVSAETWQRMRRVPSSEMVNTYQLLEIACCFPFGHLFLCLWEVLSFPPSDDVSYDSDDDDEADDEDILAFDHNDCVVDHYESSSSSGSDFDDYHYSYSD